MDQNFSYESNKCNLFFFARLHTFEEHAVKSRLNFGAKIHILLLNDFQPKVEFLGHFNRFFRKIKKFIWGIRFCFFRFLRVIYLTNTIFFKGHIINNSLWDSRFIQRLSGFPSALELNFLLELVKNLVSIY